LDSFLFTPEGIVAPSSLLKDADKAVDRIIVALKNKEKILDRQYRAFRTWIKGAVPGPGDSEYDKYAYDL